jgi:dihydroorotate dehydrogenase
MATLRLAVSQKLLGSSHRRGFIYSRGLFGSTNAAPSRSPILTGFYRTVFMLSAGLFAVYYFDARSAIHRYIITPMLRYALDAETGHKFAVKVLRSGLGPKDPIADDKKLESEVS